MFLLRKTSKLGTLTKVIIISEFAYKDSNATFDVVCNMLKGLVE